MLLCQIRCVEEVNGRSWNEEGIYRVPGYSPTPHSLCLSVLLIRLSATLENTGNLLEFEIAPGNAGNLLEFS